MLAVQSTHAELKKVRNIRFQAKLFLLLVMCLPISSWAAGKPPAPGGLCGGNPAISTPLPIRYVRLLPVGTKVFGLGNSSVDLGADLGSLMESTVASSTAFSPTDFNSGFDPCDEHLEIRAAVTTFLLDMVQLGVSVGWTPSGAMGPVTGVQGKAAVKIGTISMDFSVWKCVANNCAAIAATNSNHLIAGGSLSFEIDFGQINVGPNLLVNTPLGKVFRAMMVDGVTKLAKSPRVNELPWQAMVRESIPEIGSVVFNAGAQERILPNQAFEVFAPVDESNVGVCHVYKNVATIHTVSVSAVSSTALIDKAQDARGVQVGDVVMIHTVAK